MAGYISALPLLTLIAIVISATGHTLCAEPQCRGLLDGHFQAPYIKKFPDTKKCHDYSAHFPSGSKARAPGAGKRSQDRAVSEQGGVWSEFKPLDRNMVWRSGVCGDEYGKEQEHLKGGKYYCDAQIVKTYEQGAVFEIKMSVIAHHNGYAELHICDVAKCGNDISKKCFHDGHCQQVLRAENPLCDSGNSKHCGPIDRNYPGRWFFPCDNFVENKAQVIGGQYAKFKLPDNLHCEHCVLQWFHTAASTCNPPGVLQYFDGPDAPKAWGQCKGQGGAKGGVTRVQKPCGPGRTPEEYLQCADIRITPRQGNSQSLPTPTSTPKVQAVQSPDPSPVLPPQSNPDPSPTPTSTAKPSPAARNPDPILPPQSNPDPSPTPTSTAKPSPAAQNPDPVLPPQSYPDPSPTPTSTPKPRQISADRGAFVDFVLYGRSDSWKKVAIIRDGDVIDIGSYSEVALEATTSRRVKNVKFYENGRRKWTDRRSPYFMYGNGRKGPFGWRNVPVNRQFTLKARAHDQSVYSIQLTLTK